LHKPDRNLLNQYPAIRFAAPFFAYIAFMALGTFWSFDLKWAYPIRVIIVTVILLSVLPRFSWHPRRTLGSLAVGLLVFAIWIAPDVLWPTYRNHRLLQNSWTGMVRSSLDTSLQSDHVFLLFRVFGTAALVPLVEELFWRGWLMRYLVNPKFTSVELGTYSGISFWLTAGLFATEHGPYWDVGLLAGVAYNYWMIKTKSMADCVLAHIATNACLALYVMGLGKWQYWL
jgi:CAAX prenyl protease-like protein